MEQVNALLESLNKSTEGLPVISDISKKLGVPSGIITIVLAVFLLLIMLFGIGADLITDLIGMFYPMFMSFKALETKSGEDDKLWLTYWVVYALYKVADDWSETLFYWVPFYYPIKLAFLIFLFAPQTKGAAKLYDYVIRPFITKHQSDIESGITRVGEAASIAARIAKEEAIKKGTEYVLNSSSTTSSKID
jgi:receptor expression-enhancing protein 5/6